jgi:hypothetical protein
VQASANNGVSVRDANLLLNGSTAATVSQARDCVVTPQFVVTTNGNTRTVVEANSTTADPNALRRTINIFVSPRSECAWDVQSPNVSWLGLSTTSGSGNGSTVALLQANTGAARETSFSISGTTMTIRQCAAGTVRNSAGEC